MRKQWRKSGGQVNDGGITLTQDVVAQGVLRSTEDAERGLKFRRTEAADQLLLRGTQQPPPVLARDPPLVPAGHPRRDPTWHPPIAPRYEPDEYPLLTPSWRPPVAPAHLPVDFLDDLTEMVNVPSSDSDDSLRDESDGLSADDLPDAVPIIDHAVVHRRSRINWNEFVPVTSDDDDDDEYIDNYEDDDDDDEDEDEDDDDDDDTRRPPLSVLVVSSDVGNRTVFANQAALGDRNNPLDEDEEEEEEEKSLVVDTRIAETLLGSARPSLERALATLGDRRSPLDVDVVEEDEDEDEEDQEGLVVDPPRETRDHARVAETLLWNARYALERGRMEQFEAYRCRLNLEILQMSPSVLEGWQ
jgi:hypothetical protein